MIGGVCFSVNASIPPLSHNNITKGVNVFIVFLFSSIVTLLFQNI